MTKTFKITKDATVGELKKFLQGIPDSTEIMWWDSGEAVIDSIEFEFSGFDDDTLDINIEAKNSIF